MTSLPSPKLDLVRSINVLAIRRGYFQPPRLWWPVVQRVRWAMRAGPAWRLKDVLDRAGA